MCLSTIEVNEVYKCKVCDNLAKLKDMKVKDNKVIYANYICSCKNEITSIVGWVDIVPEVDLYRRSIAQLLDIINKFDSCKPIRTNIPGCNYIEDTFGSDRGDYYNMYIEICDSDKYEMDLYSFKELLHSALRVGSMYGYKGGEFDISMDTLVTLGSYGCCGRYILDIQEEDNCFRIIVE